jgi:hypothetical protein
MVRFSIFRRRGVERSDFLPRLEFRRYGCDILPCINDAIKSRDALVADEQGGEGEGKGGCVMCRDCHTEEEMNMMLHKPELMQGVPALDEAKTVDMVNHPPHYTFGSIEVIDAIEDWGLNYHRGQVIKYVARAKHKGAELQDLKKAQWYLNREIEKMEDAAKLVTGQSKPESILDGALRARD